MIWFCAIEFYVSLARLRCCFENVNWNTHYTTLLVEKGHKKTRKLKARVKEMKRGTQTKRKQVRQTQQQSRDLPCPLSLSSFPSIPPLSTTVHREDLQHLSLTLKSVSCAGVTGPLLAIHLNTTSLSRDCAGSSVCILHCLRAGVLI